MSVFTKKENFMFWDTFLSLCADKKVSPTRACKDMGLSNATAVHWKKGAIPNDGTVARIAKYFEVPQSVLTDGSSLNADSEKEKLFIKLFNDAPEEDRVYVIQVLQKLHDLREERK